MEALSHTAAMDNESQVSVNISSREKTPSTDHGERGERSQVYGRESQVSPDASLLATEFDEKGSSVQQETSRILHVSFHEGSEPSIAAPSIGGLLTEENE
jgi:hypothetical protein